MSLHGWKNTHKTFVELTPELHTTFYGILNIPEIVSNLYLFFVMIFLDRSDILTRKTKNLHLLWNLKNAFQSNLNWTILSSCKSPIMLICNYSGCTVNDVTNIIIVFDPFPWPYFKYGQIAALQLVFAALRPFFIWKKHFNNQIYAKIFKRC